jgi:hypothetical protein
LIEELAKPAGNQIFHILAITRAHPNLISAEFYQISSIFPEF